MHRIFTTPVASVYPHYVTKVERKGRTQAELDEVITWLNIFVSLLIEQSRRTSRKTLALRSTN